MSLINIDDKVLGILRQKAALADKVLGFGGIQSDDDGDWCLMCEAPSTKTTYYHEQTALRQAWLQRYRRENPEAPNSELFQAVVAALGPLDWDRVTEMLHTDTCAYAKYDAIAAEERALRRDFGG